MKIKIETTIERINNLIDSADVEFKPLAIMQLSQAVLSLSHAAATFDAMENNE